MELVEGNLVHLIDQIAHGQLMLLIGHCNFRESLSRVFAHRVTSSKLTGNTPVVYHYTASQVVGVEVPKMLRIENSVDSGRVTLALIGSIDGGAGTALTSVLQIKGKSLVFDCGGVDRIDSVGARDWVLFLAQLDGEAVYEFRRCRWVFMYYCSLLTPFYGKGVVRSFFADYVCRECADSSVILLEGDTMITPPEAIDCQRCCRTGRMGTVACEADVSSYRLFVKP